MEQNRQLTLGSLFSGSGGFELAGLLSGIRPVWNSEVEPFAIRVTTRRLPQVKRYGDITTLDGAKLPPVDIITFGSPCQNMSIAGNRSGLNGKQSCLFYEAVRIVKEMRCATDGKYPRFIVWENVEGAFSSNGGEDFRCVLEEICKVKDNGLSVPVPDGRWAKAGEILGDGFSVAWRMLDAQYWGVPQRRKRIYLVADFADGRAGKILFESEGVSGYSAEGFRSWQRAASGTEAGAGAAGGAICMNDQGCGCPVDTSQPTAEKHRPSRQARPGERMDVSEDVAGTLRAQDHGHAPCVVESAGFCTEHSAKSRTIGYEEEMSPTLRAGVVPAAVALENHPADSRLKVSDNGIIQTITERCGTGGGNVPMVMECMPVAYGICSKHSHSMLSDNPKSGFYEAQTSRTLDTSNQCPAKNQGGIAVIEKPAAYTTGKSGCRREDVSCTIDSTGGRPTHNQVGMAVLEGNGSRPSHKGDGYKESDIMYTLNCVEQHGVAYGIDRAAFNQGANAQYGFSVDEERQPTITARGPGAVATYCATTGSYMQTCEDVSPTLMARDYKDPPCLNDTDYIVRRLTPIECARLQGFPDWWCAGLETENPSDEELAFWRTVFDTHARINGVKPRSDAQIKKWLANPHSDSAEYRLWGNGICLSNAVFVLSGIVYYSQPEGE